MRLIITRHGETLENRAGLLQGHNEGSLSPTGLEQAKALALRIKDESIDMIYCSDLGRAVKTAAEITFFHANIKIEYTEELRERNFGEFQGKRRDEIGWSLNDKYSKFPDPLDGESAAEVYLRAGRFLDSIIDKHLSDTILLVCHGYIGKVLLGIISGKTICEISSGESLRNTSLTVYNIDAKTNEALIIDSVAHLEKPIRNF
ncbi:MAG: histidine phosphatase family protein [Bacteroidales bacterium]|nr:histidine phosphatase family protein [Bacteroidales bacterium]